MPEHSMVSSPASSLISSLAFRPKVSQVYKIIRQRLTYKIERASIKPYCRGYHSARVGKVGG